jgi:hypothetical protein
VRADKVFGLGSRVGNQRVDRRGGATNRHAVGINFHEPGVQAVGAVRFEFRDNFRGAPGRQFDEPALHPANPGACVIPLGARFGRAIHSLGAKRFGARNDVIGCRGRVIARPANATGKAGAWNYGNAGDRRFKVYARENVARFVDSTRPTSMSSSTINVSRVSAIDHQMVESTIIADSEKGRPARNPASGAGSLKHRPRCFAQERNGAAAAIAKGSGQLRQRRISVPAS